MGIRFLEMDKHTKGPFKVITHKAKASMNGRICTMRELLEKVIDKAKVS